MYAYIYHKKFYPQYIRVSRNKRTVIEDISRPKKEIEVPEGLKPFVLDEWPEWSGATVHIKSNKRLKELEDSSIFVKEGIYLCRFRYDPFLEDEWFWCYYPENKEHPYHYWTYSKEVIIGYSGKLKSIGKKLEDN